MAVASTQSCVRRAPAPPVLPPPPAPSSSTPISSPRVAPRSSLTGRSSDVGVKQPCPSMASRTSAGSLVEVLGQLVGVGGRPSVVVRSRARLAEALPAAPGSGVADAPSSPCRGSSGGPRPGWSARRTRGSRGRHSGRTGGPPWSGRGRPPAGGLRWRRRGRGSATTTESATGMLTAASSLVSSMPLGLVLQDGQPGDELAGAIGAAAGRDSARLGQRAAERGGGECSWLTTVGSTPELPGRWTTRRLFPAGVKPERLASASRDHPDNRCRMALSPTFRPYTPQSRAQQATVRPRVPEPMGVLGPSVRRARQPTEGHR